MGETGAKLLRYAAGVKILRHDKIIPTTVQVNEHAADIIARSPGQVGAAPCRKRKSGRSFSQIGAIERSGLRVAAISSVETSGAGTSLKLSNLPLRSQI